MLFNEVLYGLLGHFGSYVIPKFITVEIPLTPLAIRNLLAQEGISLNDSGATSTNEQFTRRVAVSYDISPDLNIPVAEQKVRFILEPVLQ